MKNLYIFTLEPIEQRYTKQWYKYWKEEFSKYFNVIYIDGPKMSDKIDSGKFLDINKTNIWKGEQVVKISKLFSQNKIKDSDRFIFMDGWHPGITFLKYMLDLNKIKGKIYSYWHAGAYDNFDFISQAGLGKWCWGDELSWILASKKCFVATQFHKSLILNYFKNIMSLKELSNKIKVVGFPMNWNKEINKLIDKKIPKREDLIVFPHRIDKEKCPEIFDKLAKEMPEYKFVKTIDVTSTKKEYYKILQKAKIIFSANKQETFGIGTVEAMCLGAIPIVPDKLAYYELYNSMFKYNNLKEAKNKIKFFMENYDKNSKLINILSKNISKIKTQSLESIKQMAEVMLK